MLRLSQPQLSLWDSILPEELVEQAREQKVIRRKKRRVDTTAVECNIH